MEPAMNTSLIESDACPMDAAQNFPPVVLQHDEFVIPKHRRMLVQYATNDTGASELNLYYGDKEITFDEPDLFPFGEMLAKQAQFTAGDATGWGEGYEWARIRDLLQQLIEEGILVRVADGGRATVPGGDAIRPSPLPPSTCPVARTWDDCEAITQEIVGRPVELGYLELIVPIFRVAHIAVDADQRQVGEANVFPAALRLDVPTEWRTCNLPGSRYQSERPMNVTAMRAMRAHWPQMMAAVLRVRDEFLRRFPEADGAWTVGHLQRLSTAVLAVPTYQLMLRQNRVENGNLHPALSSLFRVIDGVRITMHKMLFNPFVEPCWSPHRLVTTDEIFDYAERNYAFYSTGVCPGPRTMVRELIQVLLEGRGNTDYASVPLELPVQAAFDDLDAAIKYGFHGLRAFAALFSLWPVMTRAYERMAEIVEAGPPINMPHFSAFRESVCTHGRMSVKRTYLAHESWRASREDVYADMYHQCGRGLSGLFDAPGLNVMLAPVWTTENRQIEAKLQEILRNRFGLMGETSKPFVQDLSGCIMDFLLREQAVLRTAVAAQNEINRLLGRAPPKRVFCAADVNVHSIMLGLDQNGLPYLIDELERLLDVHIHLGMGGLTISMRDTAA
jgi:hypothetical protein